MLLSNFCQEAWEKLFEKARKAHADNHYGMAEFIYKLALFFAPCAGVKPSRIGKLSLLLGELLLAKHSYPQAEDAFRNALLMYCQDNLQFEVDMAIALKDMSETLRAQGKVLQAAQLSSLAQQHTANARRRLEKCFEIPA